MRRLVCVGVALASLVASWSGAPVAAAQGMPRILVVGDSTLLYVYRTVVPTGFFDPVPVDWQVQNCRKTLTVGCREQKVSALDTLQDKRDTAEIVVLNVGYNDNPGYQRWSAIVDTVMAELSAWQRPPLVLWMTMSSQGDSYRDENRALWDAQARWPKLLIGDWQGFAQHNAGWFVDGVHVGGTGGKNQAAFFADWFARLGSMWALRRWWGLEGATPQCAGTTARACIA